MRLRLFLVGLMASFLGPGPADASLDPAEAAAPAQSQVDSPESSVEGRKEPAQPSAVALRPRSSARLSGVRRILEAARPGAEPFVLSAWDEVVLSAYAEEVSQSLGPQAGESIAQLLGALPPTERTWVIARWALSGRDRLRLALARAAAHPIAAIGLYSALHQLAADPSPEVRDTARAALARRGLQPVRARSA